MNLSFLFTRLCKHGQRAERQLGWCLRSVPSFLYAPPCSQSSPSLGVWKYQIWDVPVPLAVRSWALTVEGDLRGSHLWDSWERIFSLITKQCPGGHVPLLRPDVAVSVSELRSSHIHFVTWGRHAERKSLVLWWLQWATKLTLDPPTSECLTMWI